MPINPRRLCLLATALVVSFASLPTLAQTPAPLQSGQAAGTLTMSGKPITLAHAAALVPADDATRVVLFVTDTAVPADVLSGKSTTTMSQMMSKAPFSGL